MDRTQDPRQREAPPRGRYACGVCRQEAAIQGQNCPGCEVYFHYRCWGENETCPSPDCTIRTLDLIAGRALDPDHEPSFSGSSHRSSFFRRARQPARPRVRVKTEAPPRRCAYCHDPAGGEIGRPCDSCGTWLHTECWGELSECPSPGCSAKPEGTRITDRELRVWAQAVANQRAPGDGALQERLRPHARRGTYLILGCSAAASSFWWFCASAVFSLGPLFAALVIALTLLSLGLACMPYEHWRSASHDVTRVLHEAFPVPCRLTVHPGAGASAALVELSLITPSGSPPPREQIMLDPRLSAEWLTEELRDEPVLLYSFGDGGAPYVLQNRSGALSIVRT